MKIIFRLCFLALLSIYFPTLLIAQKSDTHIPDYPIRKGVSAPFAGFAGSTLIVAGGCNFPVSPPVYVNCYYQTFLCIRLV